MSTQLERQTNTPNYSGKRPLNLDVFADVTISDARRAVLDTVLYNATIPQLQQMFTTGTLSSEELTRYYIDRIRRYVHYNAVLELNPDALAIAQQCDNERTEGQSSLYGIPVLLKDNIGTGDKLHTTAGTHALADSHCDRDAFIVRQLREAGAIILGKANLSEWANFMSFESANGFSVLGGQTHNAYGTFDVGGSSSGSAAAAALNLATVTIGTETSGSLVSPASQNSVCTLKPSLGLISRDRIIPITDKQDTAGPIARNMTDLAYLLSVIAGVDEADPDTEIAVSGADGFDFSQFLDAAALNGKRIGVIKREIPDIYQDDERVIGMFAHLDKAIDILQQAGAKIVLIPPLNVDFTLLTFFYGMHKGVNDYLQAIGSDLTIAKIVAYNDEDPANRAPFGQEMLELSAQTPLNDDTAHAYEELHAKNAASGASAIQEALKEHQVEALVDLNNFSTLAYATSGQPAVAVPTGYLDSGEPISITFFGKFLSDAQLIAYAYAFEQAANVWQAPVPQLSFD